MPAGVDPKRSAIMRAIKGRDTKPELKLRRILRTLAPGYRLHRKDIPGRPDVAYVGRKLAIFVQGCFWHGHDCARGRREPKANAEFWRAKIARNRARDAEALARLAASGWRAEVIWECEMGDTSALEERLRALLAVAAFPKPVTARREAAKPKLRRQGSPKSPPN